MNSQAVGICRVLIAQRTVSVRVMSSDEIDQAVRRIRQAVDDVVDDAEDISDDLRREVTDAIDDLETRLGAGRSGE